MARPAKEGGGTYEWALVRYDSGEPIIDYEKAIRLPSVTTLLGTVLAKPALVPWAVKVTREGIAQLYSELDRDEADAAFATQATLATALKGIGATSDQVRDARAAEGTAVHGYLTEMARSDMPIEPSNLFETGIMDWWLSFKPEPTAVDEVVWSLPHGYCGTLDLEAEVSLPNGERQTVLLDLKTRRAGAKCDPYETEFMQTGAYWLARGADPAIATAVLIVNGDGEYGWHMGNPAKDAEAFLRCLDLYNWLHDKEAR